MFRVRITQPLKDQPTKQFEAEVNWIEDRGDFWYFGYRPVLRGSRDWDYNQGHWGCTRWYKEPAKAKFAPIIEHLGM